METQRPNQPWVHTAVPTTAVLTTVIPTPAIPTIRPN